MEDYFENMVMYEDFKDDNDGECPKCGGDDFEISPMLNGKGLMLICEDCGYKLEVKEL